VLVRHALASEHQQLREIRLESLAADPDAFGSTYERDLAHPPEWWERWAAQSELGASQRTFVLQADDGRWLGLALVRIDDEQTAHAILNAMWVAPEARGQGAAKLLCDACATWASEHGCHDLTLAVVAANASALRAYETAGFTAGTETTWTRHDGTILNEFVMVLQL